MTLQLLQLTGLTSRYANMSKNTGAKGLAQQVSDAAADGDDGDNDSNM